MARAHAGRDASGNYVYGYKLRGESATLTTLGKTEVTADRDKIEFRLFNSSSIFNMTLREELFSLPKRNQTMNSYPGFMALVT